MPHGLHRLITALDVDSLKSARALMRLLRGRANVVKIGWRLFMAEGFDALRLAQDEGFKVFLDLKLGDIPATVESAVRNLRLRMAKEGWKDAPFLFTLQGNADCVPAARLGRGDSPFPLMLMVAWLSSESGGASPEALLRAEEASSLGCDGFIASGGAVAALRRKYGRNTVLVVPGVRLEGQGRNDHRHTLTPAQAVAGGADYVVMGRPLHGLGGARAREATLAALAADIARGETLVGGADEDEEAQKFA